MADPIVRFHGSNLIEIVDGITTHYIKKDCIQFINISAYRIGIHVVGRSDVLYMTFMDKKILHATMGKIVAGLSVMGQDELDEVKNMIQGVRNDMTTMTTTLDSLKEDIQREFKTELARSLVELSATDESLGERVAALEEVEASDASDEASDAAEEIVPVIKTTPVFEFVMIIMLVILILAAFATLFKHK